MRATIVMVLLTASMGAAAEPLRCETPRECEIAWSSAQRAVRVVANMRVRLQTDTTVETFAPMRVGDVGVLVTKEPVGEAGYEIRMQMACRPNCNDLEGSGQRLFQTLVEGDIKMYRARLAPAASAGSEPAK